MSYRIGFEKSAERDLKRVPRSIVGGLLDRLVEVLGTEPEGAGTKVLSGALKGLRRWRYRDYRVVYRVDHERCRVEVVIVADRRQIYELARRRLR